MSVKAQSEITITQISDGQGGATWYSGAGVPTLDLGTEGDFYLNTSTQDIYKKGSNDWGDPISNIKGEGGNPGQPGNDGITPHIGDNNHWFIGDIDTGIIAKGEDGQPGISVEYIQRYYTTASSKPTITTINNGVPYTNDRAWDKGEPTESDISDLGEDEYFYQVLISKYSNGNYTTTEDANNNVSQYGSYETLNGLVRFRNAVGNEDSGYTQINGSSIVTGSINAGKLYGGTLTLGGRDNGRGQLRIQDENDIEIGKWDNSGVSISKGTLELGLTNFFPDPETSGFRVKDNGEFGVGSFNNQGLIKGLYWDGNNLNVKGTIYAGEESNIYTMEQVDDIQESLEDQTSTLENAIAASNMTLSDLAEEYQYTKMDVSGLLDHLNLINKFVVVNSDGYILLGASDDETRTPLRIRIDGTAIGFYDGEIDEIDLTINRVAWLLNSRDEGDSTLHIENAEIENAQRIGDFVWQKRGQDRLTLMYSPV